MKLFNLLCALTLSISYTCRIGASEIHNTLKYEEPCITMFNAQFEIKIKQKLLYSNEKNC